MQERRPPSEHPARPHLGLPVRVDPTGVDGPTRAQARGDGWRRTSRGHYVPAATLTTVEQRIVEAGVLLPEGGAVTGWAALSWLGATWFDGRSRDNAGTDPITIVSCAHDIRPQVGVVVSAERLDPSEVIDADALSVTTAARSTCYEMRYAEDVREAVVQLDMATYSDVTTINETGRYVLEHPGWTGIPRARAALALADENSWSPWETRMRMVWILDAGLVPPVCNHPVFDLAGRMIGTPDLFDPELGVVGEFEGSLHLSGRQRSRDVRREALFRLHGLEYVTGLASDVVRRTELAARILQARDRAARARQQEQTWTLEPPPWWHDSHTVMQRRALTVRAREAVDNRRRRTA